MSSEITLNLWKISVSYNYNGSVNLPVFLLSVGPYIISFSLIRLLGADLIKSFKQSVCVYISLKTW